MNQFQQTKLQQAQDQHPLGVKSSFHSAVENGDLVGIVFKHSGLQEDGITREPYFYEIYDNQKFLGRGGGSNIGPSKLEELIQERLKAIHRQRGTA